MVMATDDPIITAALEVYSKAVRDSEARGYTSGYVAARQHVIQKLKSFIADLEGETIDATVRAHLDRVTSALPSNNPTGRLPRSGSDQDAVLQLIRQNPGLRGVEIASRLAPNIHERTVRTSLHRLKVRELIHRRKDLNWYATIKEHEGPGEVRDDQLKFEGQSAATD
jgi:hypothetical protein